MLPIFASGYSRNFVWLYYHLNLERITLTILFSSIFTALDTIASYTCLTGEIKTLSTLELIFAIIFMLEMLVKHLAVGVIGYWMTPSWRFDGVISILALSASLIETAIASSTDVVMREKWASVKTDNPLRLVVMLRILRTFLVARFLQVLASFDSLKPFMATLSRFFPKLPDYVMLFLVISYPHAVFGEILWNGRMTKHSNLEVSLDSYNERGLYGKAPYSQSSFTFPTENLKVGDGYNLQTLPFPLNGTTTISNTYHYGLNFDQYLMTTLTLFSITMMNNWHIITMRQSPR